MVHYRGITWNSADLFACKQACLMLIKMDVELSVLRTLDFGSLDVDGVFEEYYY